MIKVYPIYSRSIEHVIDPAKMDCQSIPSTLSTPHGSSIHQCYEYAQKLNNNAAFCIECGQYQRAEASLTKALRLSKIYNAKQTSMNVCGCYHCSLDGCITYTEDSHRVIQARTSGKDSLANSSAASDNRADPCIPTSSNDKSSVYQRPIRVPVLPMSEGHYMDRVLSLIIIFNLGLSIHLRALVENGDSDKPNNSTRRRALLEKSLQLYEVAYKFLKETIADGENSGGVKWNPIHNDTGSQFQIILCNNLYYIHHQVDACTTKSGIETSGNPTKYQKYLQELLSSLVFLLERNSHQTSTDDSSNNRDHQQRRGIHLERFWKTVGHLVLKGLCADAA